jgi:hypothetical protein
MIRIQDVLSGKLPKGVKRSPRWSRVRAQYLQAYPVCEVCGGTKKLNVHHKQPFWLFPELELKANNLKTLCEGSRKINCHLIVGHLLSYRSFNPEVDQDAQIWREKVRTRPSQNVFHEVVFKYGDRVADNR